MMASSQFYCALYMMKWPKEQLVGKDLWTFQISKTWRQFTNDSNDPETDNRLLDKLSEQRVLCDCCCPLACLELQFDFSAQEM